MTTTVRAPQKVDLYKLRPEFFRAPREPELVDLPEVSYLAVEGEGSPEQNLPAAIGAIYPVVYGLKMKLKREGSDFKVCTIQAQWWVVGGRGDEEPNIWEAAAERWRWRLLLMVPDFVTEAQVEAMKTLQGAKKPASAIDRVRLIRLREGPSVRVMHVGPYEAEATSIAKIRAFMDRERLAPAGRHHEVYLGDPRRTKPEKLRTILRQPVRPMPAAASP